MATVEQMLRTLSRQGPAPSVALEPACAAGWHVVDEIEYYWRFDDRRRDGSLLRDAGRRDGRVFSRRVSSLALLSLVRWLAAHHSTK